MPSAVDLWQTIASEAAQQSPLWAEALLPKGRREREPVFSAFGEERWALGLETIYEGYLLHHGRPRLFEPADPDTALLLGDYLYAHGLVRIAEQRNVEAVADLAELISLCSQLRAEDLPGDGAAWAATAALLGRDSLAEARDALRRQRDAAPLAELALTAVGPEQLESALAVHGERIG